MVALNNELQHHKEQNVQRAQALAQVNEELIDLSFPLPEPSHPNLFSQNELEI